MSSAPLLAVALVAATLNLARYALIAGPAFAIFHRWKAGAFIARRLGASPASRAQALREIGWSLSTIAVFACVGVGMALLQRAGWSRIAPSGTLGPLGVAASVVVLLVVHDAYFYWTHRLLHWKPLFKRFHLTHHRSHDPSPLAAFAFHPVEAFVNAGIAPLVAVTLPVDERAFAVFLLVSFAINVLGHLGVEVQPAGFLDDWRGRVFNTTTHHHLHHRTTRWNFGLYFAWWDRLCGTLHPGYAERFRAATAPLPDAALSDRRRRDEGPARRGRRRRSAIGRAAAR